MLFNFRLLPQIGRDVVVDSLVVIVHSNGKHLLCETLTNNVFVEVVINLAEKANRSSTSECFIGRDKTIKIQDQRREGGDLTAKAS